MTGEDFEKLPVKALDYLHNNEPTGLQPIQQMMFNHLELIHTVWWCLFFAALGTAILRFIILPLSRRRTARNR